MDFGLIISILLLYPFLSTVIFELSSVSGNSIWMSPKNGMSKLINIYSVNYHSSKCKFAEITYFNIDRSPKHSEDWKLQLTKDYRQNYNLNKMLEYKLTLWKCRLKFSTLSTATKAQQKWDRERYIGTSVYLEYFASEKYKKYIAVKPMTWVWSPGPTW